MTAGQMTAREMTAAEAVAGAYPQLQVIARVIRARGPIDPLDCEELVQIGALAYLDAYPRGRTNPNRYALIRAEREMGAAVMRRDPVAAATRPDDLLDVGGEPGVCLPRKVRRAIRCLRRTFRAILWAVYVQHETLEEVAVRTGDNRNTVATRHRRALLLLRQKLTGQAPPREQRKSSSTGVGRGGHNRLSPEERARSKAAQRERITAKRKADPDYNARQRAQYHAHPERREQARRRAEGRRADPMYRETARVRAAARARERWRTDPEYRAKSLARSAARRQDAKQKGASS